MLIDNVGEDDLHHRARGRPADRRGRPAARRRRERGRRGHALHHRDPGQAAGVRPRGTVGPDRGVRRQHHDLSPRGEGTAARGRRGARGPDRDRGPARADRGPRLRLPQRPGRPAALHLRVQAAADGRRRRRGRADRGRLQARHDHRRHGLLLRRHAEERRRAGRARLSRRPRPRAGADHRPRSGGRGLPGPGHLRGRRHAAGRLQGRPAAGRRGHPRLAGRVPRQGPGRDGVDLPDPAAGRSEAGRRQGRVADLPQPDQDLAPGPAGAVGAARAGPPRCCSPTSARPWAA